MSRLLSLCALLCVLLSYGCGSEHAMIDPATHVPIRATPPRVILKLDDLKLERDGQIHPAWIEVFDTLNRRGITGTIGLICSSLEVPTDGYVDWIQERRAEGHEIWNHGFCHCREGGILAEETFDFRGRSYEDQLRDLTRSQALAREHLGFPLVTFGAPYNATDEATARAIALQPDLGVWLFKDGDAPTDLTVVPRVPEVNIEFPTHKPNFEQFLTGYEARASDSLLVIQGHPRSWHKGFGRMAAFVEIISFLQAEGAEFVTPSSLLPEGRMHVR